MELDMVADMEVDKVADMVADKKIDINININNTTQFDNLSKQKRTIAYSFYTIDSKYIIDILKKCRSIDILNASNEQGKSKGSICKPILQNIANLPILSREWQR